MFRLKVGQIVFLEFDNEATFNAIVWLSTPTKLTLLNVHSGKSKDGRKSGSLNYIDVDNDLLDNNIVKIYLPEKGKLLYSNESIKI